MTKNDEQEKERDAKRRSLSYLTAVLGQIESRVRRRHIDSFNVESSSFYREMFRALESVVGKYRRSSIAPQIGA